MLADQYVEKPVTIRINETKTTKQQLKARLESEGVTVQEVDGMDCALAISGVDYLRALSSLQGKGCSMCRMSVPCRWH